MRNIARHEHVLEQSIIGISRALLHIARGFGADLPQEGGLRVMFDDSIITDTFQEKKQDLAKEEGYELSDEQLEGVAGGLEPGSWPRLAPGKGREACKPVESSRGQFRAFLRITKKQGI